MKRHHFAWLAAIFIFPLILSGGLVTSTNSGMIFSDWPTSNGSFNPPGWIASLFQFGAEGLEHSHRVIGAVLGVIVTALLLWNILAEKRLGVVRLAVVGFLAVGLQGVMGAGRVLENSTWLAFLHGCFAHLIFVAFVALAVLASPKYTSKRAPDRSVYRLSVLAFVAVFLQLVLGAGLRHFGAGTATALLLLHLAGALMVVGSISWLSGWVLMRTSTRSLRSPAIWISLLLTFQLLLGLATYLTHISVGFATAHVGLAALMLGNLMVLILRSAPARETAPAVSMEEVVA